VWPGSQKQQKLSVLSSVKIKLWATLDDGKYVLRTDLQPPA
jgi:hypothetical protein